MSVAGMRAAHLRAGVRAGVLATLTMDGAMLAAGCLGGNAWASDRLGPDVIGRWAAGLMRGRWRHDDIRAEPARRGELPLGLLTHYVTGIVLTAVFLVSPLHGIGRPRFRDAIGFGAATAVLPLLVLYPSLGYGLLGVRTGDAARIDRIMLLGHAAFGVGIAMWAPPFVKPQPHHGRDRRRAAGGLLTGIGQAAGPPAT